MFLIFVAAYVVVALALIQRGTSPAAIRALVELGNQHEFSLDTMYSQDPTYQATQRCRSRLAKGERIVGFSSIQKYQTEEVELVRYFATTNYGREFEVAKATYEWGMTGSVLS